MKIKLSKADLIKFIKTYWMFLLAVVLIIIDQVTKKIALDNLSLTPFSQVIETYRQYRIEGLDTNLLYFPGRAITIIPDLFYWRLVYNDGAAWSMFSGSTWFLVTISVVSTLAISFAVVYYAKSSKIMAIILSLILAGAAGNGIDRIFNQGLVVDFIDFNFFKVINRGFPIFNFADICVSVGGFLLIIYVAYQDFIASKKHKANEGK
jgi:signal peptidase II